MTNTDEIKQAYWQEWPVLRGLEEVKDLHEVVRQGNRGYIAGSFAAWMAAPSDHIKPNDVDIFLTDPIHAASVTEDIRILRHNIPLFHENYYSFSPDMYGHLPIQVILPNSSWRNFPDDLIEWFDLDLCRAVLIEPDKVLADQNIGKFSGKLLRISDPLRSLKRVIKYSARNADFNDWELLKLFQAWDRLDAEEKQLMIGRAQLEAFPQESEPQEADYSWDGEDSYRFD